MEGNTINTRKVVLGTKQDNNRVIGQQRKINYIENK